MLIVNKEHHELLIAFYKQKLEAMPEGFFGMHRGKKVVYVTKDPGNPKINRKHRLCFELDSKNGILYSQLITESSKLRAKLNYLNELWNITYIIKPRDITFPLKKRYYGKLTKEYFFEAPEIQNTIPLPNNPIEYNGHLLRSKNELVVCTNLDAWEYEYKVEIDLSPNQFTHLYPDATFYAPEIEKAIAVETDGALDQEDYLDKSERRKYNYFNNGFIEYKDVVFFRIADKSQFDSRRFKDIITAAIYCNIGDIIFPQ